MANQDFLDDDGGDIACVNGDFAIGISDDQHVMDLMQASPGHLKKDPLTGIGIINALNGVIDGTMKRIARINLEADGYKLNSLAKEEGTDNLYIDYQ
jgi:hypothetical protein